MRHMHDGDLTSKHNVNPMSSHVDYLRHMHDGDLTSKHNANPICHHMLIRCDICMMVIL